jgi:hypothetical protein
MSVFRGLPSWGRRRRIVLLQTYLLCLSISISADGVLGKLIGFKRLESNHYSKKDCREQELSEGERGFFFLF